MHLRLRPFVAAGLAAVAALLVASAPASAALELKVSSKFVGYPWAVTVKVRSAIAGPIEFRQERLDRRSVGAGGNGPGWSCVTPASASKPGYIEGYRSVTHIEYPTPGVWASVKIRASWLEFFYLDPNDLIALTQGPDYNKGRCIDSPTQFTRLQATQTGLYERPAGVSLTRIF